MATWKFIGNYIPELESVVLSTDIGDGKIYPILWDRTNGAVTDDQIVRFQWAAKEVTMTVEGTVVLRFTDPSGIDPPSDVSQAFSVTANQVIAGADWSIREPSDFTVGDGTVFFATNVQNYLITLPWGPGSIDVAIQFRIGMDGPVAVVDGTSYATYVKTILLQVNASGIQPVPGFTSAIAVSAFNDGTYTDLGERGDLFHSDCELYYQVTGTASITFTTFSLTLDDEFPAPTL